MSDETGTPTPAQYYEDELSTAKDVMREAHDRMRELYALCGDVPEVAKAHADVEKILGKVILID